MVWSRDQNVPGKIRRGKSCWLHPLESGSEVDEWSDGSITSPTFPGPALVWSQQNYQKLLVTVKYFESSQAAVPATLSRGNAGMKISESVCCKLGLLPRDIVQAKKVWERTKKNSYFQTASNSF